MKRNFGDDELQRLYKKADFDREHKEVKKIEKRIRSLVDEISVYIGRKDPLFKNFVIPSGSFYEDLKVEGPDEFDFMICLQELSSPETQKHTKRIEIHQSQIRNHDLLNLLK